MYKEALKVVLKEIENDPDLYFAFQSNIAMSILDELRFQGFHNKKVRHLACNEGAKKFLNQLIKDNEK